MKIQILALCIMPLLISCAAGPLKRFDKPLPQQYAVHFYDFPLKRCAKPAFFLPYDKTINLRTVKAGSYTFKPFTKKMNYCHGFTMYQYTEKRSSEQDFHIFSAYVRLNKDNKCTLKVGVVAAPGCDPQNITTCQQLTEQEAYVNQFAEHIVGANVSGKPKITIYPTPISFHEWCSKRMRIKTYR